MLVGAQAVYLQVGEADLAVAPYTSDADLALDPRSLADRPALEQRLIQAGFLPKTESSVGVWISHRPTSMNPATEVSVDLLVPEAVSPGKGRRSAHLRGHDSRSARMVKGLEGVLVDSDVMTISALDPQDPRSIQALVAGPAALLTFISHQRAARAAPVNSGVRPRAAHSRNQINRLCIIGGRLNPELAHGYLSFPTHPPDPA